MYIILCIPIVFICISTIIATLTISVRDIFNITLTFTSTPKCNRDCHSFLGQCINICIYYVQLYLYNRLCNYAILYMCNI